MLIYRLVKNTSLILYCISVQTENKVTVFNLNATYISFPSCFKESEKAPTFGIPLADSLLSLEISRHRKYLRFYSCVGLSQFVVAAFVSPIIWTTVFIAYYSLRSEGEP